MKLQAFIFFSILTSGGPLPLHTSFKLLEDLIPFECCCIVLCIEEVIPLQVKAWSLPTENKRAYESKHMEITRAKKSMLHLYIITPWRTVTMKAKGSEISWHSCKNLVRSLNDRRIDIICSINKQCQRTHFFLQFYIIVWNVCYFVIMVLSRVPLLSCSQVIVFVRWRGCSPRLFRRLLRGKLSF